MFGLAKHTVVSEVPDEQAELAPVLQWSCAKGGSLIARNRDCLAVIFSTVSGWHVLITKEREDISGKAIAAAMQKPVLLTLRQAKAEAERQILELVEC